MTGVEFERVEGDRLAVDHRDIAEMKVAVAAPDQPGFAAFDEKRLESLQAIERALLERCHLAGLEQVALRAEGRAVVGDIT